MATYGLLIDYDWCTGCHTCEMACSVEHDYPVGQSGLKLTEVGPWKISEDNWQYDYVPVPTKQCDTCVDLRSEGKQPVCVHHCQAKCMYFGTVVELEKMMGDKDKQALFTIR
jgi:anaerobic dimethyl sulfoxide reductase subunit B (iron-sulfur subunit)